jgi:uncharacterized membrane protein YdjX (TVP38/TMEM64 family)
MRAAAILILAAAFAAAWHWTPLGDWLEVGTLAGAAEAIAAMPGAPAIVIAAFVVGGLAMVPVTALIAATVMVFGPMLGFALALTGALASATVTYVLGRVFGRDLVRRFAGERLNRLSRQLDRRGLLALVVVRLVPVAPFTVVNLAAGASGIRLSHFLLGTAIGLTPGILAAAVFTDGLLSAIADPSPAAFALLGGIAAAIALSAIFVRRRLRPASGADA